MTHSCSSLDGMRLASSSSSSISDSLQSGAKQSQPASRAAASTSGAALGKSGADLERSRRARASRNSEDKDDDAHFSSEASCLSKRVRCSEKALEYGGSAAGRDSFVARSRASGGDEVHHQHHQQLDSVQLSTGSGWSDSVVSDSVCPPPLVRIVQDVTATGLNSNHRRHTEGNRQSAGSADDRISSYSTCYTDGGMAGYGKLSRPFFDEAEDEEDEEEEEVEEVIIVDGDYGQEEVEPVEVRGTASCRDINNRSPLHRTHTECAGVVTRRKENVHGSPHQLDNRQPVTNPVARETDLRQIRIDCADSAGPLLSQQNVCDVCEKEFPSQSALNQHYRTHTGEKPFKCDVCDAAFAQSSHRTLHYRSHTGERPYKCDVCAAAFAQSSDLTVHHRTHTGEKPFKCGVCDAAFAQSSHRSRHFRTHTGEKPYECDVCDAAFAQSGSLTVHYRTHTGRKPCKCDECGAAFADARHLTVHYRTHTGEKPYTCDVCGRAFAHSSSLTHHNRTHTGEKPYVCNACGRAFAHSDNLSRHYRLIHG